MWAHYPTYRLKKMLIALTKPPDSHNADHSQTTTVCRHPLFFVGDALALKNCITLLSVARVKPGRFSPTISNYIFTSSQIKRFCP